MAEELKLEVDEEAFEAARLASKEASKGVAKAGAKEVVKLDVHDISALEAMPDVPKTDDSFKFCECSFSSLFYAFD